MTQLLAALLSAAAIWHPAPGTSFQIQLQGTIDTSIAASVYEIDGFDSTAATVASLHALGRRAVCYFSAGSYEGWRPDAAQFPAAVLGRSNGWPGERWLDIRRIDLLAPIMRARLQLCADKGFDAVEADNVDGYTNKTGFPLTAADQLAYNRWLAGEAHARGLAIGLKNDPDQAAILAVSFEFSVAEQCFQYKECAKLTPFVTAGKAVFDIEYKGAPAFFCAQAGALGLTALKKKLSLNAWLVGCP